MESYNVGGSVSLLALNGVFRLIQASTLLKTVVSRNPKVSDNNVM